MIKRRYGMFISFFLLVATALPVWAEVSLPDLVKEIKPSVVTIITYDRKDKLLKQGSGFFTAPGHILSNRHVLVGAHRAEIKISDGTVYPVQGMVAEDKEGDLILLEVDIPKVKIKPLAVSKAIPQEGEKILVIGSPLGLEQTISDGIVSAVRDIPIFGKIIQITAPISPGSSGSPVINIKGEIIGIATLQMIKGQNLNFAVPSERLSALKPGKLQRLAEWTTGTTREGLASAEGLYYYTGLLFLWSEDYKTALSYFEKAVKENPGYADAWFYKGFCLGKLGRYSEEVVAYDQVIRYKPDYANAHYNLGIAYGKLGRYSEAVEAHKQAIRNKPDYAKAYSGLGWAYGKLGRHSEAVEAFKQAIRLKPDFAEAHNNLGWAYIQLGRYSETAEACKQAIRYEPDFAEAHNNLGVAYVGLGRYSEAVEAFKQAIRLQPDHARAHLGLGITYLKLGNKGSALEEYRILKTLDPDLANRLFNIIYK